MNRIHQRIKNWLFREKSGHTPDVFDKRTIVEKNLTVRNIPYEKIDLYTVDVFDFNKELIDEFIVEVKELAEHPNRTLVASPFKDHAHIIICVVDDLYYYLFAIIFPSEYLIDPQVYYMEKLEKRPVLERYIHDNKHIKF